MFDYINQGFFKDKNEVCLFSVSMLYSACSWKGLHVLTWLLLEAFIITIPSYSDYEDDALLESQVDFIEAIFSSKKGKKMQDPLLQFPCVQCGKVYKYKKGLWAHMKYECGKSPQFQCPICKKKCNQKSNLVTHLKKWHNLEYGILYPTGCSMGLNS